MKLAHDIENDLEHTIPGEGGWDSEWLFRAMTKRSLALLVVEGGAVVLDQACGMGQDAIGLSQTNPAGMALGLEPSNRMIRYAQSVGRAAGGVTGGAGGFAGGEGSGARAAGRVTGGVTREGSAARATVFVRALAEEMPFQDGSFDAVLCKGAMDHFMEPSQAMREAGRVLRPGGRVVLAIANYDSLSCLLGRWLDGLRASFQQGYAPAPHPYYEPPPDHMTRFGYREIVSLPLQPLKISRVEGISLLWGFPPWSRLVAGTPPSLRRLMLGAAFALGRVLPGWADVVIVQAVKAGPVAGARL